MTHRVPGIIGGTGPESTIDYYRALLAGGRERLGDGSQPTILLVSVNNKRMLDGLAEDPKGTAAWLADEVERLARAGADFAVFAANTPHMVFDEVAGAASIPLVSIVEAVRDEALARGVRRAALLGTRFTMDADFYPRVFGASGLATVAPALAERGRVHGIYMTELVEGVFKPERRAEFAAIVERMRREEGVDGVLLAGTELPLLLRGADLAGLPVLDTTQIHVQAILERMFDRA